jgi:hypothetical protein
MNDPLNFPRHRSGSIEIEHPRGPVLESRKTIRADGLRHAPDVRQLAFDETSKKLPDCDLRAWPQSDSCVTHELKEAELAVNFCF